MKNLIYQVALGRSNLYDFCTNSVAEYANKYNIEHIIQTKPILKICPDPKTSGRSYEAWHKFDEPFLPIYEKEVALAYLKEYDAIAVIDADIYVRQSAPNIFDELDDEYAFGGVVERDMPITTQYRQKIQQYSQRQYGSLKDVDWKWNRQSGAEFMNMGLMFFNQNLLSYLHGNTAEQFIRRPEFKKFVDGINHWNRSTDQTLLNYWLKKEHIPTKHLDWKWNALYRGIRDDMIPHANFVHFFLKGHLPDRGENIGLIKRIVAEK